MVKSIKSSERTPNSTSVNEEVIFEVSPRSRGRRSLFSAPSITYETVSQYLSEPHVIEEACRRLEHLGMEILRVGDITCTVKATVENFEKVFSVRLEREEVDLFEGTEGLRSIVTAFAVAGAKERKFIAPPKELEDVIEGAVLPTPHQFFQSPLPPAVGYHHLDVPADVALGLNADKAHRLGFSGECIRIAMVDSGFFAHPFYIVRGYHIDPVILSPDALGTDPLRDDVGHGTMELANIVSVAENAVVIPVKTQLIDTAAAFTTAMDQRPHIITCSWGRSLQTPPFNALPIEELPLAAAIAAAVQRGIIVCFSAGNGHIGWPAMHPDVIAVGGTHLRPDMTLEASSYASSFTTPIFPNRNVPDVTGLVGLLPRGIYIMLPGQPACQIDQQLAGGAFPGGDETANNDGWACISGTSASSPQIAGICALMLQCCKRLTPQQARFILQTTARDVTQGATNPAANQPPGAHNAGPGRDLASGFGLADATAAVIETKARCGTDCRCCDKEEKEPPERIKGYQYAVKFICGCSKGEIVSPGQYYTAINIHNPTDKDARFRKKVAVALPNERPGHVTEFTFTRLGPDEALEIDCPDIYRLVGLPEGCLLKGFVVIESTVELDVVAVYTAAGGDRQVETIHTERVPARLIKEPKKRPPDDREPRKLPDLVPVPPFPPPPPFFPSNFCKSPGELAVIVRNQGDGPAGPTTTQVDFFEIGVVAEKATPALGPEEEVLLSFDIRTSCYSQPFGGECKFRITVNASPADGVAESDTNNNMVQSSCTAAV